MVTYPSQIRYIIDGEAVSSEVTNRPIRQLDRRTNSLQETLKSASAGEAIILHDVSIASGLGLGTPVYWDAENNCFSAAYTQVSQTGGNFELSDTAHVIGLICNTHSDNSGDIVLSGVVNLPSILSFVGSGTGVFYLGTTPGTLTFNSPAISIPVGCVLGNSDPCDESVRVYVNAGLTQQAFQHKHYFYTLDPAKWLTADQFTDAPTNAAFGYNLSVDNNLQKLFPPIPLDSVSCTVDWDGAAEDSTTIAETFGGRDIPVNTTNALIQVTTSGIWWTSSDLVPTVVNNQTTYRGFRVTLHFSRITYGTDNGCVTSLRTWSKNPITFVNASGNSAITGDLYAKLDVAPNTTLSDTLDGVAIRHLDNTLTQVQVPTIHGIRSINDNITITGTDFVSDGNTYKKGLITLQSTAYSTDYELQPQVIKLTSAIESDYSGITYIGLPSNRASSFTSRIEVPSKFGSNLTCKLRFSFLGTIAGTFPTLTLAYICIPRSNTTRAINSLLTSTTIGINTTKSLSTASVFEVESSAITVTEGDTLFVTLSRASSGGYAGDIGVIRFAGILNAGV